MALKCPECGTTAHARTSAYEAPSVKRSWYQCQNLECSCTFTALESVDTIIMKPRRNEQESDEPEEPEKQKKTLNRYGSASKLSSRQQIPETRHITCLHEDIIIIFKTVRHCGND